MSSGGQKKVYGARNSIYEGLEFQRGSECVAGLESIDEVEKYKLSIQVYFMFYNSVGP